ncbi:MAG: DUF2520 domain-containing protein [Acidimicrobiia bacterium]|nr:DUF2520 domain-containing protein [Acidimicrobiia bacterium]
MKLLLAGPGRAGRSLFSRAAAGGHEISGVVARNPSAASAAAADLGTVAIGWDAPLPACDLLVIAVRDDAIGEVAAHLAPAASEVRAAVHVSGLTPVATLAPLAGTCAIGSFHPLQTLPDPVTGAARLQGAWMGVTSDDDMLSDDLFRLARSMGGHPFELPDTAKALYHAAAAAAANYPLAALAMSRRLFEAAGVPFEAAEPLVRAVVDNAFAFGPEAALTGPIARGDVGTVAGQRAAVEASVPELLDDFLAFGRAVARVVGTTDQFGEVLQ